MKFRVYYEDTDSNAIAYHTAYLRFCERDRSEIFFSRGLTPMVNETEFFVVKNVNADFLSSAKLGDELEVKTSVKELRRTNVILLQEIFLGEALIFSMLATVVYLENGKIAKIPQIYKDLFS